MYGTSDTMTEFKSLKSLEVSWESLPQLYLTLYILFTKGWQDTLPTGKVFSALTSYISVLLGFSQKKILNIDSEAPLTLVLWQIMASLIALTLHILAFTVCFLSFKYYAIVVLLLYFLGFSIIFYHLWMKHYGESQNIEVEQSYKLLQGCWSNFKLFYSANGQRIKDKKSFLSILRSHHYSLSSLFKIESRRYAHVVGVIFYTALMGVIHVLSSVEYVHLLPHLQESNQTQCDQCQSSCPQYAGPNEIRTLTYIVWGLTVIYCIEGIVEFVALQWTPFGVVIKYRGETERKEFEKQERRRKEVEDENENASPRSNLSLPTNLQTQISSMPPTPNTNTL